MRAPRWSLVLPLALILALLTSGCIFSAKARQARHDAQVHRMQQDEAADRGQESKADSASSLKQVQEEARLRQLQIPRHDLAASANETVKNFNANAGARSAQQQVADALQLLEAAY